jgi:hypothetical protein
MARGKRIYLLLRVRATEFGLMVELAPICAVTQLANSARTATTDLTNMLTLFAEANRGGECAEKFGLIVRGGRN